MLKRIILTAVLAGTVLAVAFAQDASQKTPQNSVKYPFGFSIGGGTYFTNDFGGGAKAAVAGTREAGSFSSSYVGGGGYMFADAVFAELSLGLISAFGTWEDRINFTGGKMEFDTSNIALDFGLLFKYPVVLNPQLALFPLFGLNYRSIIYAKHDGNEIDNPKDFSALRFKVGGGADIFVSDNVFLRLSVLYGIRLPNDYEKRAVDNFNHIGELTGLNVKAKTVPGHSIDVKLAAGYRF